MCARTHSWVHVYIYLYIVLNSDGKAQNKNPTRFHTPSRFSKCRLDHNLNMSDQNFDYIWSSHDSLMTSEGE